MGCSDGREPWLQGTYHSQREAELAERNDELARLLCGQCRALEKVRRTDQMTAGVAKWWAEHKKIDEERVAEVKKKIAVLDKEREQLIKELNDEPDVWVEAMGQ